VRADINNINDRVNPGASIVQRSASAGNKAAAGIFTQTLAAATSELSQDSTRAVSSQVNHSALSRFLHAAPLALNSDTVSSGIRAQSATANIGCTSSSGVSIVTPFGNYSGSSRTASGNAFVDNEAWGPMSGMRAYFYTHQPGEWMFNSALRQEFARIYGEKALVTADWTFTVPENVSSESVSTRVVDETGRPLQRSTVTFT
jgi:hypothetical protein